jgi:hypothetical protein
LRAPKGGGRITLLEILINSEKISYTLEDEKSLGDVVSGIELWLNEARLVITSVRWGDRDLAAEPEPSWSETPLTEVPRLDITARLLNEVQISQLQLMLDYLGRLGAGMKSRDAGSLEELLDTFADLAHTMKDSLDLTAGSAAAKGIAELSKLITGASARMIADWPQGITDKTTRVIADLQGLVLGRLKEIGDPKSTLRAASAQLIQSALELEEVSVLLQQGEDEKAMGYVVHFSEVFASILRMVMGMSEAETLSLEQAQVEGRSLKDHLADLNRVLKELTEAFDARDTVLLGDLLEYEISPRLEPLVSFLGTLQQEND